MKKIMIAGTLCFVAAINGNAQTINGKPLKDLDTEFIEINTTSKPLSNKFFLEIDLGQETRVLSVDEIRLKDSTGRNMTFNSRMDALNFMKRNGYELVQAYAVNISPGESAVHYLLRKKTEG